MLFQINAAETAKQLAATLTDNQETLLKRLLQEVWIGFTALEDQHQVGARRAVAQIEQLLTNQGNENVNSLG